MTTAVTRRVDDSGAAMATLRANPPATLAGIPVTVEDLSDRRGQQRTDALVLTGAGIRVVVRPSGTEPKLKSYIEVHRAPTDDLSASRSHARALVGELASAAQQW
jgi:phosphomannomutase